MKILVLMPLDEKWSYIATELWKNLGKEAKQDSFSMPMFTEWQMQTKKFVLGNDLLPHWNVATLGTILKTKEVYQVQAAAHKNFLLIGNISPDFQFDAIFNFQDPSTDALYEDHYLDCLREKFKDTPVIAEQLKLYDASASTMPLHDIKAAAAFLTSYLQTDPHLDEIKTKYQETLHFKETPDAR